MQHCDSRFTHSSAKSHDQPRYGTCSNRKTCSPAWSSDALRHVRDTRLRLRLKGCCEDFRRYRFAATCTCTCLRLLQTISPLRVLHEWKPLPIPATRCHFTGTATSLALPLHWHCHQRDGVSRCLLRPEDQPEDMQPAPGQRLRANGWEESKTAMDWNLDAVLARTYNNIFSRGAVTSGRLLGGPSTRGGEGRGGHDRWDGGTVGLWDCGTVWSPGRQF
jgi:hypothetical protein